MALASFEVLSASSKHSASSSNSRAVPSSGVFPNDARCFDVRVLVQRLPCRYGSRSRRRSVRCWT